MWYSCIVFDNTIGIDECPLNECRHDSMQKKCSSGRFECKECPSGYRVDANTVACLGKKS